MNIKTLFCIFTITLCFFVFSKPVFGALYFDARPVGSESFVKTEISKPSIDSGLLVDVSTSTLQTEDSIEKQKVLLGELIKILKEMIRLLSVR